MTFMDEFPLFSRTKYERIVSSRLSIFQLFSPYRYRLLLALGLAVSSSVLALAGPFLIQRLLLRAGRGDVLLSAAVPAGLLLIAVTGHALASSANNWLLGGIALDFVRNVRQLLYQRVHQMPVVWFDRTPTGAIMSRLMDDVSAIQSIASGQALATLIDLVTAAAAGLWISTRSLKLAAVIIAIAPIYVLIFRVFGSRIRGVTLDVRRQLDQVFARLKQKIDGVQAVRAAAAEHHEANEFAHQISALHQPRVRAGGLAIAFSNLCVGVGGIGASLVFAVGAFDVLAGALSIGDLITATVLAGVLFAPIARFSELAAQYQQVMVSFSRLSELLDQEPHEAAAHLANFNIGADHHALVGAISFENVCFQYVADRPLLKHFSLTIKPGMRLAIVGPTGSGKTTLMNLLLGFYQPNAGQILIDNRPLADYSPALLRQEIGVVQQEPVVFRATLAENVGYGTPDADRQSIERAAKAALLDELAARLPRGYDTLVGEGAHPLSQGERQRIALARLFCKNPSIVVLDEATSSLDKASEEQVQRAQQRLLADRTTVVIAHRLATVQSADEIIVMDGGELVQQGNHETLLADSAGLYRQLYESQFAGLHSSNQETNIGSAEIVSLSRPVLAAAAA